jgi:hypothetical protein
LKIAVGEASFPVAPARYDLPVITPNDYPDSFAGDSCWSRHEEVLHGNSTPS